MFDKQALFSEEQAITTTAVSTNVIDLGTPTTPPGAPAALKRDIGAGDNIPLSILITEAFAGNTSLTVDVQVSTDEAFTSPITIATTGAVLLAALTLGKYLNITTVPREADKQFIRLNYTVAGTATAGKITAGISTGIPA